MSLPLKRKRIKGDSYNAFDNVRVLSAPIVSTVYGNKIPSSQSTVPVSKKTNSSVQQSKSSKGSENNDPFECQRKPKKVTTIVEKVSSPSSKNHDPDENSNCDGQNDDYFPLAQPHPPITPETIYAVMLPLILNKECVPYNQPILVRIKNKQLDNFGIDYRSSNWIIDQVKNYFEIKLNGTRLTAQILATSGTIIIHFFISVMSLLIQI